MEKVFLEDNALTELEVQLARRRAQFDLQRITESFESRCVKLCMECSHFSKNLLTPEQETPSQPKTTSPIQPDLVAQARTFLDCLSNFTNEASSKSTKISQKISRCHHNLTSTQLHCRETETEFDKILNSIKQDEMRYREALDLVENTFHLPHAALADELLNSDKCEGSLNPAIRRSAQRFFEEEFDQYKEALNKWEGEIRENPIFLSQEAAARLLLSAQEERRKGLLLFPSKNGDWAENPRNETILEPSSDVLRNKIALRRKSHFEAARNSCSDLNAILADDQSIN